ncbi:MAG: hypothetical protein JKY56_08840 [Kofleriaceae bacterium]|nr:hypothetical protein [Kofleriaceae bacterium]
MLRELFVVLAMTGACSAEKVATTAPDPKVAPEPVAKQPPPETKASLKLSISSVYMVADCPEKPAAKVPMKSKRAKGELGVRRPRCTQSTLQLSVDGALAGSKINIGAIQILAEDGGNLGEIGSREPTIWTDGGYGPWDEILGAGQHRIAYKISVPNWSEVEAKIGGTSYGPMFFLEIQVESGGAVQTIRSPGFPRSRVAMIKT